MVGKEKIPGPTEIFWERLPTISKEFLVETVDNLLAEQNLNNLKLCTSNLVDTLPFKDWGAYKQSLLLEVVDPSLYCYVSGETTKELPEQCDFEKPCVKKLSPDPYYSEKFQILPAEFYANPNSKTVTTRSYINNLDPRQYGKVYESIEQIVAAALPHFEKVLTDLVTLDTNSNNSTVILSGRPLQIFVGIKNIHLTPKASKFPGSQWHTEGLRNERVVASGIYYYDIDNISESKLAFRVQIDNTNKRFYLGHATAQSNRLVVFPNIYEHSVMPFQLENNSKSGHRKFITLFLVDPATKIISTANVSPQQEFWYPIDKEHSSKLFPPTGTKIFSTKYTMTLEKAKQYRIQVKAERVVMMTQRHRQQNEDSTPAKKPRLEKGSIKAPQVKLRRKENRLN